MPKAQVYAKLNKARIAPKKVAVVMDLVRGKDLEAAKVILAFDPTKAAELLLKVVRSAEANAKNNLNLSPDSLYVSDLYVDGARIRRWWYAGSKGRYDPIIRRNSHIVVGLSEKGKK